ncbi:hypothetical protein CVS40_9866 [Lucilia cuprina]|nr:hypothetical protein CVS40_9866 [Lucilia cuprina]
MPAENAVCHNSHRKSFIMQMLLNKKQPQSMSQQNQPNGVNFNIMVVKTVQTPTQWKKKYIRKLAETPIIEELLLVLVTCIRKHNNNTMLMSNKKWDFQIEHRADRQTYITTKSESLGLSILSRPTTTSNLYI